LTVRDEDTGTAYEEDRDFARVVDPKLTFRFDRAGPTIRLLPGSRLRDGQALRVSYYHGMAINDGQVTICMSEPKVYDIWRKQAELIQKHLAPKRWLLSMDEIRAGGSCKACKARKMTMAQILGDCITRQFDLIRGVNPSAEVYVWSDMLDPNHNAHGNYYLVDGDFSGSWQYVPKDLRIACWYYEKRKESLAHFSGLGFKTLAGAYYDADTLENPEGWLEALKQTPDAVGIMYTTWQNKYKLLGPFGDLVSTPYQQRQAAASARGTDAADKIPFDTYSGYFVSNQFEPDAAESFLVLTTQKEFDKVFGVAFVMGDRSHRLPKDAFESNMVLAAIKRGKTVWEYKVERVAEAKGVVALRYTADEKRSESASFACPLILSIPKGKCAAVQFIENGKPVKTVEIGKK
jgi:hypothetical protein